MNSEAAVVGIVLQVQPYEENGEIAVLWTEELGRLGLYARRSSRQSGGGALLTPLNEVEVVVGRRQQGLWRCKEVRLRNDHRELRNALPTLNAAGALLQAILRSQPVERPSPLLYHLFFDYLRRLKEGAPSFAIAASFYLKVLRHEGLWSNELVCARCGVGLPPVYLYGGEVWCQKHALPVPEVLVFTAAEWDMFKKGTFCRRTEELLELPNNAEFLAKVETFFLARMS